MKKGVSSYPQTIILTAFLGIIFLMLTLTIKANTNNIQSLTLEYTESENLKQVLKELSLTDYNATLNRELEIISGKQIKQTSIETENIKIPFQMEIQAKAGTKKIIIEKTNDNVVIRDV